MENNGLFIHEYDEENGQHRIISPLGKEGKWRNYVDPATIEENGEVYVVFSHHWFDRLPWVIPVDRVIKITSQPTVET